MKNKRDKKKTYRKVIALPLIAICLFFISCNRTNLYKNYKDYEIGYNAAHKGSSEPSFLSSDAEKKGYEEGLRESRP